MAPNVPAGADMYVDSYTNPASTSPSATLVATPGSDISNVTTLVRTEVFHPGEQADWARFASTALAAEPAGTVLSPIAIFSPGRERSSRDAIFPGFDCGRMTMMEFAARGLTVWARKYPPLVSGSAYAEL